MYAVRLLLTYCIAVEPEAPGRFSTMMEVSRIGSSSETRARELRSEPPPAAAWTMKLMSFSG
ncbi:hypothetical protein [Georgenia sp. SUBG003]|uniref:hypothetical protein n=1 Tax=Georgenia sp. SUBG003 TaxID=1497974 RepID=UPI003AB2D052